MPPENTPTPPPPQPKPEQPAAPAPTTPTPSPVPDEILDASQNRIGAGDAERASRSIDTQPKYTPPGGAPKRRFRDRLKALLTSKKFWAVIIFLLIATVTALWFIDPTRIKMVNLAGRRTQLAIDVTATSEGKQPRAKLTKATVKVNNRDYTTDDQGKVVINDQPYGKVHITASKRGYEEISEDRFLDLDPFFHKFGGRDADQSARHIELSLKSVGLPVSFKAVDWLSGKPISTGTYTAGDLKLQPDEQGIVTFKAPPQDSTKLTIHSDHTGTYNDKTFELPLATEIKDAPEILFVPAGKDYFLSSRDGALSLYSSLLDGSQQQLIIPGTGKESPNTAFAAAPSGKYGILATTRDGAHNDKNTTLQRLYVVDLEKKQLKQIDEGLYFELTDWYGDKIAYKRTAANPADPNTQATLKVADVAAATTKDLATARGFGRVVVGFDRTVFIEHTPSDGSESIAYRVKRANLNTGEAKELSSATTTELVQISAEITLMQTQADQKWHQYNFNSDIMQDSAPPNGSHTKVFFGTTNPDKSRTILLDRIDGKFTITTKTTSDGAEKQLFGTGGLTGPIHWAANNVIIFRVVTTAETADYALSVNGGEPKKINDVTATADPPGITPDINQFKLY